MHHVDRATPWDEIWQAMERPSPQGKILYVGTSNFAGWHIAAGPGGRGRPALHRPGQRAVDLQPARPRVELEVIPAAQEYGLGVIPWSPLHGGLLGGVLSKGEEGVRRLTGRAKDSLEKHRDAIQAYEDLALELGDEPGELALAWLLHQPAVTAPIVGPRTVSSSTARSRRLTWS